MVSDSAAVRQNGAEGEEGVQPKSVKTTKNAVKSDPRF
jgi:hypothetical protein